MLLDAATLQKSSEIHPAVLEYATANPIPDLNWDDAESVYDLLDVLTRMTIEQLGPPEPTLIEEYKDIPMRDGTSSKVKVHRPATPPSTGSPLIVFFFGGGWISGGREAGTAAARAYVRLFGATVVNASYRLAPQHKFPTAQFDCWDTVKWLDSHPAEVGADPRQGFLVSGISAGGSNAACVTAHALEGGEPLSHPITGQHLCVPSIMTRDQVPEKYREYFLALDQNRDAPVLPASALEALERHTAWDAGSPWRYAINSKAPLADFPPTYFQVDGMDTLRDDGLIYEEMLKEAGVRTRLDFYPGCPHAHFAFVPDIAPTMQALGDMVVGVGWLLGKSVTLEQGLAAYAKPS